MFLLDTQDICTYWWGAGSRGESPLVLAEESRLRREGCAAQPAGRGEGTWRGDMRYGAGKINLPRYNPFALVSAELALLPNPEQPGCLAARGTHAG